MILLHFQDPADMLFKHPRQAIAFLTNHIDGALAVLLDLPPGATPDEYHQCGAKQNNQFIKKKQVSESLRHPLH